jgi:zinc/manganese transport system substrate-binding protein
MKQITMKKCASFIVFLSLISGVLAGCGTKSPSSSVPVPATGTVVQAVGAENEYADIIRQVGGDYVSVTAIISNPGTDPHSYEANTADASIIGKATLIVQNGLGYDDFMDKLESGSPNLDRVVINVAEALGYPDTTKNPHIWYKPDTMPRVAALIASSLESQLPDQKQYFEDRLAKFNASLKTWNDDLKQLQQVYANTGVAVTEPVSDYLLEAAHLDIKTPWAFQAAIMNGIDPSPQDVKTQQDLFTGKQVKVFVYNQQAVGSVTNALLKLAKENNIPVVGVYETMPPGYTYQTWMEDETRSLIKALKDGVSTETFS